MNKAELIEVVTAQFSHTKTDVTKSVEAVFEETKRAVAKGEKIAISGFGVFERADRKARTGRNPQTGEEIAIAASTSVGFKAAAQLKRAVNG